MITIEKIEELISIGETVDVEFKEGKIERLGPNKGGYWKIVN